MNRENVVLRFLITVSSTVILAGIGLLIGKALKNREICYYPVPQDISMDIAFDNFNQKITIRWDVRTGSGWLEMRSDSENLPFVLGQSFVTKVEFI